MVILKNNMIKTPHIGFEFFQWRRVVYFYVSIGVFTDIADWGISGSVVLILALRMPGHHPGGQPDELLLITRARFGSAILSCGQGYLQDGTLLGLLQERLLALLLFYDCVLLLFYDCFILRLHDGLPNRLDLHLFLLDRLPDHILGEHVDLNGQVVLEVPFENPLVLLEVFLTHALGHLLE